MKRKTSSGHTLIEILVSIAILSGLALMLAGILGTASNNWVKGEEMVEASQAGRTALELIGREITGPVVGPQQQFIVLNGATLRGTAPAKLPQVPSDSMSAFWLAPLGSDGQLRRVGYYLERVEERGFYRLKRLLTSPNDPQYSTPAQSSASQCPASTQTSSTSGGALLSDLDDPAFDDNDPNNDDAVVSTVVDGVIGLWFQSFDSVGNEIPWVSASEVHPVCESGEGGETGVAFNSASYFMMTTASEMDATDTTFEYYRETESATKGDRLPAAVEITLLTIDPISIDQAKLRHSGATLPEMTTILDDDGVLDVEASVRDLKLRLEDLGITKARTFSTRVKLANGS